jgi:undecaprenyl-diphosphatase
MDTMTGWMPRVALALALLAPVQQLDDRVQHAVQEGHTPALDAAMRYSSSSRGNLVVAFGLLVVAIATGPAGPATARAALGVLIPVNVVVELTKRAVNRTRPDGEADRGNASFPSSHAANAAALAMVLSLRWPRLAPVFVLYAGFVAFSRIYLNRHFLSDVLCGVIIGVGVGWLGFLAMRARGWTWLPRGPGREDPEPA